MRWGLGAMIYMLSFIKIGTRNSEVNRGDNTQMQAGK
jgi:hypothetical protein